MDTNENKNVVDESVSLQRPAPNTDNVDNSNYAPQEEEEKGVTFSQIWHMIIKHWVALVLCTLLGLAGGVIYARAIKKPEYQASTQLMIINTDTTIDTSTNISESMRKTQIAYGYMTSEMVVKGVARKLSDKFDSDNTKYADYDFYLRDTSNNIRTDDDGNKLYNVSDVSKLYSVTIPTVVSNTTSIYLNVSAKTSVSQLSIDVANFVVDVTIAQANDSNYQIYSVLRDSVTSMGQANSATDTSTSNAVIAIIGVLIGVVVGAAYGIIRELADTHVSSKADLENLTGYKVIGMIPKYEPYDLEAQKDEKKDSHKAEGGKENA